MVFMSDGFKFIFKLVNIISLIDFSTSTLIFFKIFTKNNIIIFD